MLRRSFVAAACVLSIAGAAWAIDDRVLGRDDIEFAQALVANGYHDLAKRLLVLLQRKLKDGPSAVFRKMRLDIEQADAIRIDDPIGRSDALIAVLHGKQQFVDDFRDTPAAVDVGDSLPDLCVDIGGAIAASVRYAKLSAAVETLRTEGDSVLQRAEQWLLQRIEAFDARAKDMNEEEFFRLVGRKYGRARTLYAHALIFERGSERRVRLCNQALEEFESADLWSGSAPLSTYHAYVWAGQCLNELGKTKEAIESFDKVICLRLSYGDADAKTGVYPIPSGANDVVDLVCYACLQKVTVLRDAKKPAAAVAAAKDYFATIPAPFDARSAIALATALARDQVATGDLSGAGGTVDALRARDASAAETPAAELAHELDVRGAASHAADPTSLDADELWLRAAKHYETSVAAQVAGKTTPQADRLRAVADRLFAYGLHFNRVPSSRISFVDWAPAGPRTGECWKKAVPIYEAALAAEDDRLVAIQLGRTYGYLQKWTDAARVYAGLFEQEPMLAKDKLHLDSAVTKSKPELTLAYLEWGVAERMAAQGARDGHERDERLNRCLGTILMPLAFTIRHDSNPELFWGVMHHLVRALMDKGLYKDALAKCWDLQRSVSPTFDDGKFGYQKLFEATLRELR